MDKKIYQKFVCSMAVFHLATLGLIAQEMNFKKFTKESMKESMKDYMKESMRMETMKISPVKINPDSVHPSIDLDANNKPLPRLGFNYKQNSLYLHHKDSLPIDKKLVISEDLLKDYTNKAYNPDVPPIYEQENKVPSVIYNHLSGRGFISISGIVNSLFKGKSSSKKEKALKYITEEVYPITGNGLPPVREKLPEKEDSGLNKNREDSVQIEK
jgi:hypothetical protein